MKRFFSPSIYLMNQLPLSWKFLLINTVFAVPLVLLSYGFAQQMKSGIEATSQERAGLALLSSIYDVSKLSQKYQDSASVEGFSGHVAGLPQRIISTRKEVNEKISQLEELVVSRGVSENVKAEVLNVRSNWQRRSSQSSSSNGGFVLGYKSYRDIVLPTFQLVDMVTQETGLVRDTNVEVINLIRLISEIVPKATQSISQARAYGTYGTTLDYLDSMLANELDDTYESMNVTTDLLKQAVSTSIQSVPSMKNALGPLSDESINALVASQKFLDEKIIIAESLDYPTEQYFDQQTVEIEKLYSLVNAVIPVIDGVLSKRLAEQEQQLYLLYGALAVVYATIIYLFGGFYLSIMSSFGRFIKAAGKIAQGDMTVNIDLRSRDEVQDLANEFNAMSARVRELISDVLVVANDVSTKSKDVEGIASSSVNAIERQLGETSHVTTAMNQMTETVYGVAHNSAKAASIASQANSEAEMGQKVVNTTLDDVNKLAQEIDTSVAVINRVAEDSNNINQVLDVIKGIAEQTNLLALNAAIEAARAGEQGRGFAVVADEVRTLAQRTHQSTEEIESMINRLQSGVNDAVKTMETSHEMANRTVERSSTVADALVNIVQAVNEIVGMNHQIATAAEEQSVIAKEINENILRIDQVGKDTATGAQNTNTASQEMAQLVGKLQGLVNTFTV